MMILLVNTFHYNRGGDSVYTFELSHLLRRVGNHEVINFAMQHPFNVPSQYSSFFVSEIDLLNALRTGTLQSKIHVLTRAIYSNTAKIKLSQLLNKYPVDIAHIQNIHGHITPSIFHVLRRRNIPIVWTLHDYFLLCPNSTFYTREKICDACKGNKFYNVVIKKCRKNSVAASFVVMLEEYIHRLLGLLKIVDFFIAPSQFLENKLLEYGFPSDKVIHIPHFIESKNPRFFSNGVNYIIYLGRLSYEKGLKTLIKAISLCNSVKLLIAGDGPMRAELVSMARNIASKRVEFLGHVDRNKVDKLVDRAMFMVLPSEWHENFPYSILEAFASHKPVIGSRIGGIPELVRDGETGLLFEPGNVGDLFEKIKWMLDHPKEREKMGRTASKVIAKEYNPELHYDRLLKVYRSALSAHGIDINKLNK